MFNYLDTQTFIVVGLAVTIAAFFIGSAMNNVLEHLSFGTIGNMVILIAGAFLGFYLGNMFLPYSNDAAYIAIKGVCGGFISLAALILLKTTLRKFGF